MEEDLVAGAACRQAVCSSPPEHTSIDSPSSITSDYGRVHEGLACIDDAGFRVKTSEALHILAACASDTGLIDHVQWSAETLGEGNGVHPPITRCPGNWCEYSIRYAVLAT